MPAINGHALSPTAPPDPRETVAKAVIESMRAQNSDEDAWEDLTEQEQESERAIAGEYIAAHLNFLASCGMRVIPMNAVAVPKSENEALAMVQAAQSFLDARKRKKTLISPKRPRLILPTEPQ